MKMRNMIATMTAVAVSAISFAAMSASAAVTDIPYTGPSTGAMAVENNGTDLRLNLINEWTTPPVTDIAGATTVVEDNITVTFTVSGIGTNSNVTNEDGTAGAAYYAYLSGMVGTSTGWDVGACGNDSIPITGDGQYTVTWNLAEASESISCLIISTNINLYNYGTSVDDCGVVFTLNSITTGTEDAPTEPQATEPPATDAPAATTTAAGTTAAAGTTTAATTAATTSTTTNANTGDNGIAIALAALTGAGALALVSKKRD